MADANGESLLGVPLDAFVVGLKAESLKVQSWRSKNRGKRNRWFSL